MLSGRQAYVDAVEGLRATGHRSPDPGRAIVDRAVGLLAGRTRCRLADAHRHLLRMAAEQNRDVADVAAGVIGLLDIPDDRRTARRRRCCRPLPASPPVRRFEPWLATVQKILDVCRARPRCSPRSATPTGRLVDLVFAAVSPEAVTPDGRRGTQLLGTSISGGLPGELGQRPLGRHTPSVLDTGEPPSCRRSATSRACSRCARTASARDCCVSWTRHDHDAPESDRVASTERLGNLGWGEWDLVSGEVSWSDQLYRIYERDPALGPMPAGGVGGADRCPRTCRCGWPRWRRSSAPSRST